MRISDWSSDVCSSVTTSPLAAAPLLQHRCVTDSVPWPELAGVRKRQDAHERSVMMQTYRALLEKEQNAMDQSERLPILHALYVQGTSSWRSEERRVGKGCVSTCRFGWSP